jgi:hypothetical protein
MKATIGRKVGPTPLLLLSGQLGRPPLNAVFPIVQIENIAGS